MKNIFYTFVILIFALQGANAQSVYYYYNDQKVYIDNDTEYISVNSSKNGSLLNLYRSSYVSKTKFVENNSRNYAQTNDINLLNRTNSKNYYSEIKVTDLIRGRLSNYNSFINTLNNNSSIIKASPCFKTVSGKRLGLTNNFYVKIKPGSINSLYEYAQRNNLEVLGKDPYMDNWYIRLVLAYVVDYQQHLQDIFFNSRSNFDKVLSDCIQQKENFCKSVVYD